MRSRDDLKDGEAKIETFLTHLARKEDEAKKIIKSMYKLDSPFVRYALPSSYCVHYPRLAHSKPPRYLQYTIAELSYGPIAQ